MDFHVSRIQTSKKPYRCHSTGARINPGDRYYYLVGVYEGDFGVDRMHLEAYKVYQKVNSDYCNNNREFLCFNDLLEYLTTNNNTKYNYNGSRVKNKNFLRDLGYARRIAKLEGVPGWFTNKFSKKN